MLKEFWESLTKSARETVLPQKLPFDGGDGREVYFAIDGRIENRDVRPEPRHHEFTTLESFAEAVNHYSDGATVWVGRQSIVALIDDDDRRDRLTLHLPYSEQWKVLLQLQQTPVVTQEKLVQLLRTELLGIGGRESLLQTVSKIKWHRNESGEASITHAGESMGKSIQAAVSGAGNIPEDAVVTTTVYANPDLRDIEHVVAMSLQVLHTEQKFRLKPIGDELIRVQDATLAAIFDTLKAKVGENAKVFVGTP
jgi:hypothetical protein